MFSAEIQLKLKNNGFDLTCAEENIWILEDGENSVTISGEDHLIEAIWQTYEGEFEEITSGNINEVITWSKEMLNKK